MTPPQNKLPATPAAKPLTLTQQKADFVAEGSPPAGLVSGIQAAELPQAEKDADTPQVPTKGQLRRQRKPGEPRT